MKKWDWLKIEWWFSKKDGKTAIFFCVCREFVEWRFIYWFYWCEWRFKDGDKMLKVMLVDDEEWCIEELSKILSELDGIVITGAYSNVWMSTNFFTTWSWICLPVVITNLFTTLGNLIMNLFTTKLLNMGKNRCQSFPFDYLNMILPHQKTAGSSNGGNSM